MNSVTESEGVLEVKSEQKQFPLPPENEPITGVIAGWKNLGEQTVVYKGKSKKIKKVACKIFLDALDPETGDNLTAYSSFNASTHEKSGLVAFLKSLTGKDFSGKPVNVLETVGITASFIFKHSVSKSNGRTYANISSVFRVKNQKPLAIPAGFVAFKTDDEEETAAVEVPKTVTTI